MHGPSINNTSLFWVPGHCSMKGDERVGELARKGSAIFEEETIEGIYSSIQDTVNGTTAIIAVASHLIKLKIVRGCMGFL